MKLKTYEIRLRFQAKDAEDATQAIDGMDDNIESWDPPFWLASEPRQVREVCTVKSHATRELADDGAWVCATCGGHLGATVGKQEKPQ